MSATPDELALLEAWPIGLVLSANEAETGTVHRTLLVEAETGRYALRCYRHSDRAAIEREHLLIAFARARAIPAVAPLPTPSGETLVEWAGRFAALFPHAPGRQLRADELRPAQIAAMGRMLARLHLALRGLPRDAVALRPFEVSRQAALETIDRISAAVRERPALSADDQHALGRLLAQRTYVERATPARPGALLELPQQPIHGDYLLGNLFFSAEEVVGIIDWDQAYVAPRAWEVIRTLDLAFGFAGKSGRVFLDAYRSVQPLTTEELDTAAIWYSHLRAHDLWLYEAIYLAGNERVRRLVPPGAFVPLIERWAMSDLS
ncbi:MAG: hypothetical protein OHK0022_01620 [Roseiflexaceae bacterium]